MAKQLQYDYTNMLRSIVKKGGVSDTQFKKAVQRLKSEQKELLRFLMEGEQGFIQTLYNAHEEQEILELGNILKKRFKQLLIIGIGGSDLGARALQQAFPNKQGLEVLFLGDTPDPVEVNRVLNQINWKHCAVMVVSKSGNTIEPLSTFLLVRDRLSRAVGRKNHHKHLFVLTQDQPSLLHDLASQHDYQLITHPHNIGGRWTVLSKVALISAAASGIDIKELRKGARDFVKRVQKSYKNPALYFAALHLAGFNQGMKLAVLMPYSSRLETFGAWYRQLFGESLGKAKTRKRKKVYAGLTPIVSVGPKDQHSQIQLYNEGPIDKLITFIKVKQGSEKLVMPKHWKNESNVAYLDGKHFHSILNIELDSTAMSLRDHQRANGTIELPELTEYSLGQLFVFFELACVYLAEAFDIDAFNQPGVEEGKNNMYALLGKKGYEEKRKELSRSMKMKRKVV